MNIVKERYSVSRMVGAFIRGLSYVVMTIGVAIALSGFANTNGDASLFFISGIAVLFYGIVLLLPGELMRILIDVEENSRRTSYASVLALPEEKWKLFDISVDIPSEYKAIKIGGKLKSQITLIQAGFKEKIDVNINYIIKDFEGKTHLKENETIEVFKQSSYDYEFKTQNLPPGDYVAGIEVIYPDGVSTASSQFKILETKAPNLVLSTLLITVILVFILLIIIIKKYKKKALQIKRYRKKR